MATINKPIALDETLQSLVSKQNDIKTILNTKTFAAPILQNKTISLASLHAGDTITCDTGFDGLNTITITI